MSGNDDLSRIALYVRVSSAIHTRLARGEWPVGAKLPTLDELCQQYQVSRNTMRQAIDVLRTEGLVRSARGQGIVVARSPEFGGYEKAIRDVISNPLTRDPDVTIKILSRRKVRALPPEIAGDHKTFPEYMHLRKLHCHRGIPYEIIDVYVEAKSYRSFPARSDEKTLISRLVMDHGPEKFMSWQQEITVGHPDIETSHLLDYSMTRPVVRIRRQRFDKHGRILLGGIFLYRGDMFVLDIGGSGTHVPFSHVQPLRAPTRLRQRRQN